MAGVADKARYYAEQFAPQLNDFKEKGIFSPDEIRSLAHKHDDFEHLVLSPGSKPSDWLAYAKWERSLEALRTKRCKRLKVQVASSYAGQGRIFGILERAVGKHPGSIELWKEYLKFAQDAKATKRWRKVMSRALRMHPAKPEMWVMAGRRAASNGDMQAARGFFMRGTRFCAKDATVWVEYARCEMDWLDRLEARKTKKGGVDKAIKEQAEYGDDEIHFDEGDSEDDIDEDGRLVLPNPDGRTATKSADELEIQKSEKNPALEGAIPQAIFDIAKKQPFFNAAAATRFFDLFASFTKVSSQPRLVQHVLDTMTELYPNDPATCSCLVRQALIGADINSPTFVKALREALAQLNTTLATTTNKTKLAQKTTAWIEPILSLENVDPGIRVVLEHTVRTLPRP
ncbi:U3 small nucleolar RNA-associated protein 6-domain-containing protein [Pseudomassariella vexata]|uniref:U3 small nucleolar RNA-associated protein 6-domain-containing protein n=1 Tax=Pseudomassariella vexata TaxID=1141098 RepID=A0A1Y2E6E7_9PEZI|nr:U3 small nucleolar RNA-associated protein 6-domain-containing protein [Pseudomassariella vexata]ORY67140.1 U3 small nucleolar RNA-associated protein 6-domain-containing protein [Pseudomassariella vexata]